MTATDQLSAQLHDLYVSGPPYGCEHDLGPDGDYVPRCIEDAARLRAAGAAFHTITPECGPICWTTGHHHDVEACDGCRRLADTFFGSGAAQKGDKA